MSTLSDAIAELLHDGDTVAFEGFTHLIPVAAGESVVDDPLATTEPPTPEELEALRELETVPH
jgi:hypothetical protein